MADRIRDGTTNKGERSNTAKLTSAQVLDIRTRVGETQSKLAEEFGVSKRTISDTIRRRTWKHI
jgi:DNA-binding transcriptional regulator YiaG